MNLFGVMETSGSAMQAERMRAEVVAANMANAETTRTATGGPYHRQHVVFAANQAGQGTSGFLDSLAATTGASTSGAAMPAPLGLLSSTAGQPAGGVHIAQVVEDPAPPRGRMDMSHIRTLTPSQRWWT